jgi:zinc protease
MVVAAQHVTWFSLGGSAEFATPDDQCVFEQPALFQVAEQGGAGLVDLEFLGLADKFVGSAGSTFSFAAHARARYGLRDGKHSVVRDMPQSVIVFGHEGILRSDPDFMAAYVMSEILGGGGLTSRLTEEIREKRGLTYGVSFGLLPMQRTGVYAGVLQTKNESAGEALDLARKVIARYAEEGPTQAELDEAKTYLTGSYALRFSSNAAIANQLLGLQQQNLGIGYVETRNAKVEAVTLEQVKAQARRLLHPDRLIVSVVGRPEGIK